LQSEAARLLDISDIIVVVGGASVGEKDFAKSMFAPLGIQFLFNKVAMRPGKPVWMGQIGRKIVLGLPGNPTSALITARLFLAPVLAGMGGDDPSAALVWHHLPLIKPVGPASEREWFMKARLKEGRVLPLLDQDSAGQKSAADSDLIIRRLPHAPAAQSGEFVWVLPLNAGRPDI
jgi:molybdopterin molybdotransferase